MNDFEEDLQQLADNGIVRMTLTMNRVVVTMEVRGAFIWGASQYNDSLTQSLGEAIHNCRQDLINKLA